MRSSTKTPLRTHAAALAAVVALLAPALFPHVHGWLPAIEIAAADRMVDRVADSHSSSCPLCRAQNDARSSLLPSVSAVPLVATAPSALPTDTTAALAVAVRTLASPRAPPLLS